MKAEQIAAQLTPEQLEVFIGALQQRALFFQHNEELYAAAPNGAGGWWMYELRKAAPEYGVNKELTSCTCPAEKPCKHLVMLKSNPGAKAPWKHSRITKQRRRGPR